MRHAVAVLAFVALVVAGVIYESRSPPRMEVAAIELRPDPQATRPKARALPHRASSVGPANAPGQGRQPSRARSAREHGVRTRGVAASPARAPVVVLRRNDEQRGAAPAPIAAPVPAGTEDDDVGGADDDDVGGGADDDDVGGGADDDDGDD